MDETDQSGKQLEGRPRPRSGRSRRLGASRWKLGRAGKRPGLGPSAGRRHRRFVSGSGDRNAVAVRHFGTGHSSWCAGDSDEPLLAQMRQIEEQLPPFGVGGLLRRWPALSLAFWGQMLSGPRGLRFPPLSALLPQGAHGTAAYRSYLGPLLSRMWPAGLWICATRRDTGQRVVFGAPGSPTVPLAEAVAASSAIPTYFEPVDIDGAEYVDGGLHSSTNADLLAASELDVAVVIAPMSTLDPKSENGERLCAGGHIARSSGKLPCCGQQGRAFSSLNPAESSVMRWASIPWAETVPTAWCALRSSKPAGLP